MPNYYTEAGNKAAQKYKKKNIEQIGISFQRGQGTKEAFQTQAEKRGVSVNKYVIDMMRADADGRVIVMPEIGKREADLIMQVIGQKAPQAFKASIIIDEMDEIMLKAVKETADSGGMMPEQLVSMILSSMSSGTAAGIAQILLLCLEANGADRDVLHMFFGNYGSV